MTKQAAVLFAALVALTAQAPAEDGRPYPASKYTLVPESRAHLVLGQAPRGALDPSSIKVLVWNIKKGQEPGLARDMAEYGSDRDLFLISEGYLNPLGRSIFESFANTTWDMGISFLYNRDHNYPTGTLIGSRVEPTGAKVRTTKDLEPLVLTPKCTTFARYAVAGSSKPLLAISVHGINAVPRAAFERHLAMIADEVTKHDGPVLLGGDFNTNLRSKVDALFRLTGALRMRTVAFRNDERKTVGGNFIDYIFTRGLRTRDAEVLGKLTSSDHKAMLAEFSVEPSAFARRRSSR